MITITVNGQQLSIASVPPLLVEGTKNFIPIYIKLDKVWKEFETIVQFIQNQDGEDKVYPLILPSDGLVYIPPEIKAGTCKIFLYGTKDAEKIATTSGVSLTLNEFNGVIGADIIEVTPDLYEQFVAQFQETLNEVQSKYNTIEERLDEILDPESIEDLRQEIATISDNFSTFTEEINGRVSNNSEDINSISASLTSLSEDYGNFVENINGSINTLTESLNDDISNLNNLQSNVEEMQENLSQSISDIQSDLETAQTQIETILNLNWDEHKVEDWITETADAVVLEDSIREQVTQGVIKLIKNQKTFENILYVRLHFNIINDEAEELELMPLPVNAAGYIKLGELREDIQIPFFTFYGNYFAVKYVPAYYETLDFSVLDENEQPKKRCHSGLVQISWQQNPKIALYFLKDDSLLDTEVISRIEFTVTFQSLAVDISSNESNEEDGE